MFQTVLIANRGEIACRVIRTLRQLGIRSVAVYTDPDAGARHVREADVAVRVPSYLDGPAILAAAADTGAQAIHPGYGFLSENTGFATACSEAGIVFVGPPASAIEAMGDKIRAKAHVAGHGVPVIPGTGEAGMSDEQLIAASEGVGFPLLIKPSAGGGGKGMSVVDSAAQLPAALETARRVAQGAFGDDTLLLERFIASPRHIEVQVLADAHGQVIHLGERECSLQRRHQKIIEEAPSPLLDAATRAAIGEAACQVARSVGYGGAGTVEFLVSDERPDEFFFMEMNTRLQVEHPVTELVTGLDLVAWQLRIAAGEPLTIAQDEVELRGHAIEGRVYAEDPARGFLPATGTVLALHEPADVRVDSALIRGLEVTADYDPMLAKVIAHGADRAEALTRLDAALAETVVLGVTTNIAFLRSLLARDDVREGRLDTGLIDRLPPPEPHDDPAALAAAALIEHAARWGSTPWARPSGWRAGTHRPARYDVGTVVSVLGPPDAATVTIDGTEHPAALRLDATTATIDLGGRSTTFEHARDASGAIWLGRGGAAHEYRLRSRAERLAEHRAGLGRAPGAADPVVRSAMPGRVVAISVGDGDAVEAGQPLVTIEAMKMEHAMPATLSGTVALEVAVGDQVRLDQVLARIEGEQ